MIVALTIIKAKDWEHNMVLPTPHFDDFFTSLSVF
jgi:hypothetical protein